MRLTDCTPKFWSADGAGRKGLGISFDCPLCVREGRLSLRGMGPYPPMSLRTERTWAVFFPVAFKNPLDGGPPDTGSKHSWQRTGDTFDTLTLSPSIDGSHDETGKPIDHGGHLGWHGHVLQGAIVGGGI